MAGPLQRLSHAGAAVPSALASNLSISGLTFVITAASGWPTGAGGQPFGVVVDPGNANEEKLLCVSQSAGNIVVASTGRGYDGTIPIDHQAGAIVEHVFFAVEVDDANAHIYDGTRDDHAEYARSDGTRPFTGPATFDAGITVVGPLAVTGNGTVSGTLAVGGAAASLTLDVTGLPGATAVGRFVGNTAAGPPAAGTFIAGDTVVDATGAVFTCVTGGSPGTWSVPVGGLAGHGIGPVATLDANNSTQGLCVAAVPLVLGRRYLVFANAQGVIVGPTAPSFALYEIVDSAGLLVPTSFANYGLDALAVNQTVVGSAAMLIAPTSTASVTFTISSRAGTGGGALRTVANAAEFSVVRVT